MIKYNDIQHVFIVGAKGVSQYGGYETFVDKLTEYHQDNKKIKYHIACKANGHGCMDESKLIGVKRISDTEFTYHNARCFKVSVPNIGAVQPIYYDVKSLHECCRYIEEHQIKHPIIYILACRIGSFATHYYHRSHRLGGKLFINPDGACEIIDTTGKKTVISRDLGSWSCLSLVLIEFKGGSMNSEDKQI